MKNWMRKLKERFELRFVWICKNANAQVNILINRLRARHYIFEIFSVSLIRLQRLNDLSSTSDSIVPVCPYIFEIFTVSLIRSQRFNDLSSTNDSVGQRFRSLSPLISPVVCAYHYSASFHMIILHRLKKCYNRHYSFKNRELINR